MSANAAHDWILEERLARWRGALPRVALIACEAILAFILGRCSV